MKKYKISLILFLLGLFFVINSQANITGAVVGVSVKSSSFIGLILMVLAGLLYQTTATLEGRTISLYEFMRRIDDKEPDKSKRAVILDTSVILPYSSSDMESVLQTNKVLIPRSVLDEIDDSYLKQIVKDNVTVVEVDPGYKKIAKKYLEETSKNKFQKILKGELPQPTSRVEAQKYMKIGLILKERLRTRGQLFTKENLIKETKRSFPVSETDVDVLAVALFEARHHKHTIVGENDSHLQEAIENIKKMEFGISEYLDYVNPYQIAA